MRYAFLILFLLVVGCTLEPEAVQPAKDSEIVEIEEIIEFEQRSLETDEDVFNALREEIQSEDDIKVTSVIVTEGLPE